MELTETLVRGPRHQRVADRFAPTLRRAALSSAVWLSGVALGVGGWQLASVSVGGGVVPSPATVIGNIVGNFFVSPYLSAKGLAGSGGYGVQLGQTAANVALGVGFGAVVGTIVGLGTERVPVLGSVVNPVAAAIGGAPIFVVAPFFLIWFGIVPFAQVAFVAFYTGLLMYIFSVRAIGNVGAHYVESATTLGATSWMLSRWLYLPAIVPEMIGAFRIALAGAWGLEGVAELLGAQRGIGFLIRFYAGAYDVVGMMAVTVLLGVVAVICDRLVVVVAGRTLLSWTDPAAVGSARRF